MNNFERITASPEALGDFLGALPILSGPWDDDFHRVFCDSCDAENCDAENCAHQAERNNPTWWLKRAYTGSGPVKTDSTNPYKRQAADLRLEAMHQRDRFGRNLLATELEEAAAIDGCSRMGTFWRIVFPLLKPVTMTVVVLSALGIWNDYQIALVVVSKEAVRTLPVAQQSFIGQQISYLNLASAACLLSILPMFFLFLFLQKFIVQGVTAGAVKG